MPLSTSNIHVARIKREGLLAVGNAFIPVPLPPGNSGESVWDLTVARQYFADQPIKVVFASS